ncbi:17481_t:CDS:2 [Funneliformis geosporum]|uniref:17481_t:CDS:1 n=1 Tax=Funneliformis geosporum TaxID=1117311 RepID=A0A9W4WZ07_9GLOM|nr:17481_t:CDS:2 [Funneliformis geosporum]
MRVKLDPQSLRNRLLVQIIKEKGNTVSISEKSEIATAFYEELKFRHDQRDQAEQVFRNTVECLYQYDYLNDIEVESESESESDYDTTDDEFDESYCTAEIINISDHEAVDQHSELKKWVLENRVPDITDKEKDTIDNYVLDVFERNVEGTMKSIKEKKVDLNPKDASFVKRILDTWAYKWKSEFNETMSEPTYTATWIAPDFEILKSKDPGLFDSSWCEMIHPSSKWRRRNVYKSNKKTGRKCDGILFIKSSAIERLVFENVCSPKKEKLPKYYNHFVMLSILCAKDFGQIGKEMWKSPGNITFSVDLLSNNKLENQGELWRICLAGKDKFLAERIYKLEIPWKFEDDWTKLADVCKMLLLIESIFRCNDDFYHDYTKSVQKKNIVRVAEWLSLNPISPQKPQKEKKLKNKI